MTHNKPEWLHRIEERLMKWAVPITIADPTLDDCPVVFANEAFCTLTGYSGDHVLGRNCRFLQGARTVSGDVEKLHEAVHTLKPISLALLNYRANGTEFHNLLYLEPIALRSGERLIAGCQFEFTPVTSAAGVHAHAEAVTSAMLMLDLAEDPRAAARHTNMQMRVDNSMLLIRSHLDRV